MNITINVPFPVAARSKAWVYGLSLAGIVGSKPAGSLDVCCECCVLSGRGRLLRADPSSRGDLPNVYVSVSVDRYSITLYTYNVEVHIGQSKTE